MSRTVIVTSNSKRKSGTLLPQIPCHKETAFSHMYERNAENSNKLATKYLKIVDEAMKGGGEKNIQRHIERNKKFLVRDRIRQVLDPESPVIEVGKIAGHDMSYGTIASAGAVGIIGKVHGTWCMLFGSDATVKGGSIYPITLKKQLRCQDIAQENLLPCIYLIDSGGAFLPLQSEIFNPGGKMFYNQAVMSSEGIPQIAYICGSCTAGAAYIPTMAQEAVILDKIGTIFLAGPPLVKAATGEIVTPEELGGADLHCRLSGCTDHFVRDEQQGFETIRNIVLTSKLNNCPTNPMEAKKDLKMRELAPSHTECTVSAYEILRCLADSGGFHEYKELYGNTLITGFMYINGSLLAVIANDGYLTQKAAKKGCNFVQLCSARDIPILFLQNVVHDENLESADLKNDVIKTRGAFMQAIASSPCPKIVVSVGGLVGSPHTHSMCSLAMGARFHFVWPNVKVMAEFPWNSQTEVTLSEYRSIKKSASAFYGASQFWYDGIVLPEDTKDLIYLCLNVFEQEQAMRDDRSRKARYNNQIVFRM